MRQVHLRLPLHGVAAARERYPQPLAHADYIRIRYVVRSRDVRVRDEAVEDGGGNAVEALVGGLDGVGGHAVGDAGAVGAAAGEGDEDGLVGEDLVGGRGGRGEVVGAEEGGKGLDLEEGLERAEGGDVGRDVTCKGLARGGRSGVAGEGGSGGGG